MSDLIPISIVSPGHKGLNTQEDPSALDSSWATLASNAVFDSSSRLSTRSGWTNFTSTPPAGSPSIEQIFIQNFEDGTGRLIATGGLKIFESPGSMTDITGTATVVVGNNWQFVNFNGKVLGFQQGEQPITAGGVNFSDLVAASGTAPQGNCAVVHSGRVWAVDTDYQTIKYSALLDETKWAVVDGAGSIDMSSVWPHGTDTIVALAMYNGQMVVFGKNKIVLFGDGAGSVLGINPSNIYVTDTIIGVGCVARDSIQQIEGGDIFFLSNVGVQSLSRLIIEKSNPINNVTRNIRDSLLSTMHTELLATNSSYPKVRSLYSPENAFYLLTFPSVGASFGFTYCIDTTGKLEDGSSRITTWTFGYVSMARDIDGVIYMSANRISQANIGTYSGTTDNGAAIHFDYNSPNMDFGPDLSGYVKMVKSIGALVTCSVSSIVTLFGWQVGNPNNPATDSSSVTTQRFLGTHYAVTPGSMAGQTFSIGLTYVNPVALQRINLLLKPGRMVR